MLRLMKYIAGTALGIGILFGITRQPVIDASPEPLKTGLQKIKMDMDRVTMGRGWENKKKPGSGDGGGGGGTVPLYQRYGIGN